LQPGPVGGSRRIGGLRRDGRHHRSPRPDVPIGHLPEQDHLPRARTDFPQRASYFRVRELSALEAFPCSRIIQTRLELGNSPLRRQTSHGIARRFEGVQVADRHPEKYDGRKQKRARGPRIPRARLRSVPGAGPLFPYASFLRSFIPTSVATVPNKRMLEGSGTVGGGPVVVSSPKTARPKNVPAWPVFHWCRIAPVAISTFQTRPLATSPVQKLVPLGSMFKEKSSPASPGRA